MRVEKFLSSTRSPKALETPVASTTRLPEMPELASPMFSSLRLSFSRSALSWRRDSSRRLRPSLRARRAVTPLAIQWASRWMKRSRRRASSSSWALIFSAQSSKAAKPASSRFTRRYSSQKLVNVTG